MTFALLPYESAAATTRLSTPGPLSRQTMAGLTEPGQVRRCPPERPLTAIGDSAPTRQTFRSSSDPRGSGRAGWGGTMLRARCGSRGSCAARELTGWTGGVLPPGRIREASEKAARLLSEIMPPVMRGAGLTDG